MRLRSKRLGGLIAIAAASVVVLGACSTGKGTGTATNEGSAGFASCDSKPNTCNTGTTKKGGTLVAALEKTIQNWNVNDGDGNTYETVQVLNAITPSAFLYNPDSTIFYNKDLLAEEPKVTNTSPQTVVYKINPAAQWSDGTPISAKDFIFNWKYQNGKDCPDCSVASTLGYESIKSVEGSDNDKTVTVTFSQAFPDWKSLFGPLYPASVAAQAAGGDLNTPANILKGYNSFKQDPPKWSGGPYMISDYQKDVSVTEVPNPKWYGKTKPSLDKIVFRMIEDQAQQLPAMQNKEIQMMTSQPNPDMVSQVKGMQDVMFNLSKGPTWEHIDLNLKNKALADKALRQAIFTAIDRQAIINKTVGPFFQTTPLGNHNIMNGMPNYKDVIAPTGQGAGNVDKAKQILTDAGYKIDNGVLKDKTGAAVPSLRFGFTNGNQLREQSGELVQAELKQIGLDVKLTPFKSLGNTLSTGDFDIIIYAWVGTPFISSSKDIWSTGGGQNYGHYSNTQVDELLKKGVEETDANAEANDFNQADALMAQDAYSLPLYQKPVFIALYSDYLNIRNNPTSQGPVYNIQEWGLKTSAK